MINHGWMCRREGDESPARCAGTDYLKKETKKMKKILGILLAVMMLFAAACAIADEVPQPEGGKKFESDWAVPGGIIEIYYEEEGYRVYAKIEQPDAPAGAEFEYSCYYQEETDCLMSVSSIRSDYTVDPDTGDEIYADEASAYEGIDEEGKETVFTIDGIGKLMVDAINQRDLPLVQGGVMYIAVICVIIYLLVDILYAVIDPRIRLGGGAEG